MAKYRPISPEAAWRDPKVSMLDIQSRYLEIYFLTSTFGNVIGCYRLVSAVAAAETGMSCDEFQAATDKLEANRVVERYQDYFLVRRWFRHHLWQSVLTGNVAKRAAQEIAILPMLLREKWIDSCLEAGAPKEFVDAICQSLTSPFEGPSKGSLHSNNNQTKQNSTTTSSCSEHTYRLAITARVEPFRDFVEQSTFELDQELAQQVADELSGILDAVDAGKRPAIGSLQKWLPAVVKSAKSGLFVPQWGLSITRQREMNAEIAFQETEDAIKAELQKQSFDAEVKVAEEALHEMSVDLLDMFATRISASIQIKSARARVMDALKQRKVPRGPGCIEVIAAIKNQSAGANNDRTI